MAAPSDRFDRCLNITDNDQWLELDQESVRRRTTWMTWFAFLGTLLALTPLAFSYLSSVLFVNVYYVVVTFVFTMMAISFILAFNYYVQIYRFARKEAAELEAAMSAAAAAAQAASAQSQAATPAPNGKKCLFTTKKVKIAVQRPLFRFPGSFNGNNVTANNIFDDSEDEVLLDPSESPIAKQESAVFSAMKTMFVFSLVEVASAVILVSYGETPWKYALLTSLLTITRTPGLITVCIFNFGPIRNTVSIYLENLPGHMSDFFGPVIFFVNKAFSGSNKASDDQRCNIVEASHEDLERATSPAITKDSKPNIVGKRDSAVSPSNSNHSSLDELPAVQC